MLCKTQRKEKIMPPKARYTKEYIADIAYGIVRRDGLGALSARSLAAELGTSTAPIFTAFENIEEVESAVVERAEALYERYHREGLAMTPQFKGTGIKYIQFAKDEPNLFKLLFMRGDKRLEGSNYLPKEYKYESEIREQVESDYGLSTDKARDIYNHLSIYTHGLAVLYAQGSCVFSDEEVSRLLSEMFFALTKGGEKDE